MPDDIPFDLSFDDAFEPVARRFENNFKEGLEHGASFVVYQNGQRRLALYGGWADKAKARPVTPSTLFSVFSTGKAVAALMIAHLAEQNLLGYDQPIKSIWPEFSAHEKGELSISEILSHQSGLCGITNPNWQPEDWYDWEKTCNELAAQAPIFPPKSASGYGPITYGFLAGEIARRADQYGRTLGQILHQDFAIPFDLDIWIGLRKSEHERCSDMQKPKRLANLGDINAATRAAFLEKWSAPGGRDITAWREAEFAGSNCQAGADSLARLMQMLVDGSIGGTQILSEDIAEQLRTVRISGPDLVLPFSLEFCAGIMRNNPNLYYGPQADSFGHSGWGGSCVFADPHSGIHGCYAMNQQENSLLGDPRPVGLIDALYGCI